MSINPTAHLIRVAKPATAFREKGDRSASKSQGGIVFETVELPALEKMDTWQPGEDQLGGPLRRFNGPSDSALERDWDKTSTNEKDDSKTFFNIVKKLSKRSRALSCTSSVSSSDRNDRPAKKLLRKFSFTRRSSSCSASSNEQRQSERTRRARTASPSLEDALRFAGWAGLNSDTRETVGRLLQEAQ